jgi:histidinol-phosphatase
VSESDLAFALELADVAATIALPAFGGRLEVKLKADRTPVTEIDVAVERALREAVARAFPDDAVLGEEEGRLGSGRSGRTWIVDPIDGTKNFADGVPLWTTMIALVVADVERVAVVDTPALGTRHRASRGGGAWCEDRRLAVSETPALTDALVLHSGLEEWLRGGRLDGLTRVAGEARRTRGLSDSWGQLLVAQGSADVLLEHEPCGIWDWAASRLIVEEAGGRVTTLDGKPPGPGCDLLVSNGRLHDEVVALL